ncbi:BMP family ABC transporter substrate-binding protein [Prosthecochloris sp. N3]|uniref:BMP family ABC transporter substrate-binding protein n=1 Tax=Prosthecochloris ethylica TaxID=2743976 RepID=A0ABR9XPG2_9CHLB|nr:MULTISPECIES: BMP family ABC transporter substrate-binding protein [Prosthecochloris]MBF0586207.1 BMP family ABC transporter substrate-binding protein [Prosthecochloris ethylica]MBF0635913.1 BMP family ABC transporter substrate-binding protein [Prosthecochloris ethylica]NUK47412.1 BMP family ABC transporter substrate-binding protein [Prosthecochloris ethylica]RNA64962.1 BMP family ABC transporter substrate-binding protein [Prosthecochloris sp. ZM_2]
MIRSILTILLLFSVTLAGCSRDPSPGGDDSGTTVGMVFDVGGRGDNSFNDAAYSGLLQARDSLGVGVVYVEPSGEGADREAALRNLAADPDIDLVFGVGLLFSRDIAAVAEEFPETRFVCIDYQHSGDDLPANFSGIVFEDRKGSFLAGAMAGLLTESGTLGFIGGMDSAIIRRFQEGFSAGARHVNPDISLITAYIGMTGSAFTNPARGKELALNQYSRGADIIYQAAGASGLGVIEAARETGMLVIGTDRDQYDLAPGHVLSSIVKGIDRAVFTTVVDDLEGRFRGGEVTVLGLDGRYTDYVYNQDNAELVTPEVHRQLENLREDIISGAITVE